MKTPEQYFEDHVFAATGGEDSPGLSPEEKSFLDRYLGGDSQSVLKDISVIDERGAKSSDLSRPEEIEGARAASVDERMDDTDAHEETASSEAGQDTAYRGSEKVQMISFRLGKQEFALPVSRVKEVLRYQEPTKLPGSPEYIEGIVNLRGRVTPMVRLAGLVDSGREAGKSRFIIVCRHKGLQIGLIIDSIATMNHIQQQDIEWGVESSLGANCDLVEGVIKGEKGLIAVLSVDRLADILVHS
ncbi:MAG: chemotaxis protein CheW [Desulfonatronovibrionaceae bacterium]